MKTIHLLALTGLVALAPCLLPLAAAHADVADADGLGSWEGTGLATGIADPQTRPFTISLVRKSLGSGAVRADGTIRMNDGKEVAFWQEFGAHRDGACKLTSSQGNGGGRCFANHMCQYYTERNDGHAFATTVAIDGENSLRVLVTELENGKAVRFFSQSLVKKR
jgi:hypothetical protein